jgi:Tol biopolymer transport system component
MLVATMAAAAPSLVEAQYFGRNKVQYQTFDFRVLSTQHYDLHYYPAESLATADAARMAERWYTRLSGIMRQNFNKKPLVFYADHPDFEQTNVIGGFIDQSTGGVTEAQRNRVVMPFTGIYAENDHVLGHEMVHVFQYDIAENPTSGGFQGLSQLPLWLIEGMAEYLSVGREDPHTAMWMRDAALRNDLPSIKKLTTDPRYFPYRYGQALWAYIGGKWGDQAVSDVYRASLRGGWDAALRRVVGISSDSLSKEWLASIRTTYLPLMEGRAKPTDVGQALIGNPKEPGEMNVAPAVSADGKLVAFFARKGLFTVDLFVADATTGQIVKKLTGPNADPHFDALSFVSASGSWSPDNKKLAFISFEQGDNRVTIFDVNSRSEERSIGVKGVGAINDAAWSPDGKSIVISGQAGGLSDLFLIDVTSGQVRRLTNDRYAELHPAWSPDGRTIAFTTDRGPNTDFQVLKYGPMNLALMDVASGSIREIMVFPGSKHINPQYAPDGRQLYFVSDREGFSDIYRLDLASNQVFQVTRTSTGVSGITANSPTLSVARQTGRLVFSVFHNGGNLIRTMTPEQAQGTPVPATVSVMADGTNPTASVPNAQSAVPSPAGILVPVDAAATSIVQSYLADATTGLQQQAVIKGKDYNPKLELAYLGAPTVGIGVSNQSYGNGIAGAVSAGFSDMLETREVGAALAAQGTFKDIGGEVYYKNTKHRWNWLTGASHIPYVQAFQTYNNDVINNTPVVRVDQIIQRVYVENATFITQYPFSQTRRIEFSAGYNRYAYGNEGFSYFYLPDGEFLGQDRSSFPNPPSLAFGQASVALVGDYSYYGFTSPVAGGRYRFEVSPAVGQINFTSLLGDYRRYFFWQPVTFAMRGLYYGRFGKDADDRTKISPLYLGQETLIRGYDANNFDPSECTPVNTSTTQTGCAEVDRLLGSKLGVANFEMRLPLFGVREYGLINFPYLPTDIQPFFDAGVAWAKGDSPDFTFSRTTPKRVPVFSTGVSARMNVLGYMVLEAYYAYPFQRPDKGWTWGFVLSPGW